MHGHFLCLLEAIVVQSSSKRCLISYRKCSVGYIKKAVVLGFLFYHLY